MAKQIKFDDLTAMCIVLKEGVNTDARTLRSQAEAFVKTQIFQLCQLYESHRIEDVLAEVNNIKFGLDGKVAKLEPNIRALFTTDEKPCILLVADTYFSELYQKYINDVEWYYAGSAEEALQVLAEQDIEMVLLDIWLGRDEQSGGMTIENFDHTPIAARALDKGQELLRRIHVRLPNMPVFLLSFLHRQGTREHRKAVDDELLMACVRGGGARGMIISSFTNDATDGWDQARNDFSKSLRETCTRLHRERAAEKMGMERKVIAFDTVPQVDHNKKSVNMRIRNLRLTRAIASADTGELLNEIERPAARFDDVIGAESAKQELKFFIDYLRNPRRFAALGVKPPKGVLLHGPPGTGKTMLARALAGESDVAFIPCVGNNLESGYVGGGAENVRKLFTRARRYAPAIIFIDEIDSIARTRTGQWSDSTLNALLTEMDGFKSPSPDRPVFVLAATNFDIDENGSDDTDPAGRRTLDPALVRRFSRTIFVDLPDRAARLMYLNRRFRDRPHCTVTEKVINHIADKSAGMAIANLELIIETAARKAAEKNEDLTDEYMMEALECHPMPDDIERPTTKFADVIGADTAKEELQFIINYIKDPEQYMARGLKPPKGILLHGPPGTGKTMLARAMAGESNVAFISTAGSSLQSRWVGGGPKNIRDLFARGRRRAPAIIFIDEIDAIGKKRGQDGDDSTLNALLTEMDGFTSPSPDKPVFILAATNFDLDDYGSEDDDPLSRRVLDPALVRRFSRTILVDLPDRLARIKYLNLHLKDRPQCTVTDETIKLIGERSAGMAIANLELIIQTASRRTNKAGTELTDEHLIEAFECHPLPDDIERPNIRFKDVIGADTAKEELQMFVDYLKDPSQFAELGFKPPGGILFHGPPGTGKTLLAQAMAGESNVAFIPTNGSSFVTIWHGSGPQNVRKLFQRARRRAPAIIFIDEIDSIGKIRTGTPGAGQAEEKALNALIAEMQGFISPSVDKPILILAASNFHIDKESAKEAGEPDKVLDPALVRRFRTIEVKLPDTKARQAFLKLQLEGRSGCEITGDTIDQLAAKSVGKSLDDLKSVIDAAFRKAFKKKAKLTDKLLIDTFDTIMEGEVKIWDPSLIESTAYHEAGHTIMYWLSGWWAPEVSIVARRNRGGGMYHDMQEAKRENKTREEMLAVEIRTSLGGRAAEIVKYGPEKGLSTGPWGDFEKASDEARKMVCIFGMDEDFGPLSVGDIFAYKEAKTGPTYERINETARKILKSEMANTIELLKANRQHLDAVAKALLEKNTLYRKDLEEILPKRNE